MTILAFGCSVAHGIDIITPGNSEENLECSYPNLIAKYLKVECESWAFAGNSNENMFYQFMENVSKFNKEEITAVVIGWTSPVRDVWVCEGRTWQFIPSWCATSRDVMEKFKHYKNHDNWSDKQPCICTDDYDMVSVCSEYYRFFALYKFDITEYLKKRQCYITAIRNYCQLHNIKLIETCWDSEIEGVNMNLGLISPWVAECRHPTKEEHEMIAKIIIHYYKL